MTRIERLEPHIAIPIASDRFFSKYSLHWTIDARKDIPKPMPPNIPYPRHIKNKFGETAEIENPKADKMFANIHNLLQPYFWIKGLAKIGELKLKNTMID